MASPLEWRALVPTAPGEATPSVVLPEAAAVPWRPRVNDARLHRAAALWTATTVAHVVPFLLAAVVLLAIEPLTIPVVLGCLAHAWVIPELYAARGANVVRPRRRVAAAPERVALGLLGDLVDHDARELHGRTGLVREPGALGTWFVGEAGALLVRGRRVFCWCVKVDDPDLPSSDRIAHLLLALRTDEAGFATVANLAFAGARWRVRRRLGASMRPVLDGRA
ncbi:MAG: hypothetical protein H0U79_01870 [Solirubrobacterales bacterium]|nr:hypothetical protein [Solirubrobacterales bacterium]